MIFVDYAGSSSELATKRGKLILCGDANPCKKPKRLAQGLRLGFQIFHLLCNKVSIAQLLERLTHEQEDPGLIPREGEIFFT